MEDLQKAAKLREVQGLLDKAMDIVQRTVGSTDNGQDIVCSIEDALLNLAHEIQDCEEAYL